MEKCRCEKCNVIIELDEATEFLTCYNCQSALKVKRIGHGINGHILDDETIYTGKVAYANFGLFRLFFIAGGIFSIVLAFILFDVASAIRTPTVSSAGTAHYFSSESEEITETAAFQESAEVRNIGLGFIVGGVGLLCAGIWYKKIIGLKNR